MLEKYSGNTLTRNLLKAKVTRNIMELFLASKKNIEKKH